MDALCAGGDDGRLTLFLNQVHEDVLVYARAGTGGSPSTSWPALTILQSPLLACTHIDNALTKQPCSSACMLLLL